MFAEFDDGCERGGPALNRDWPAAAAAGARCRALVGAGFALRVGRPGERPVPTVEDAETAEPIKADPAGLDAARAAPQARKHARTA